MTTSASRKTAAGDPAATFFDELGRRGNEPLLRKVSGRVRFDLVDDARTDSWLVAVDNGELTVTREAGAADCTVRGERAVFDEIVGGRTNAIAAVLRGALVCHGDLELFFTIQRIFPGPASRVGPDCRHEECVMSGEMVKILNGNTFVVSDRRGDIEASSTDPTGLFSFDTRFLSKWVLTVNGDRLTSLSTDDLQYFEARFFLVPGVGSVYVNATLSVIRQRAVGNGFHEELTILNHDDAPVDLTVRIDADCDFADLFEVKDALQKKGSYTKRVDGTRCC